MTYIIAVAWYVIAVVLFFKGDMMLGFLSIIAGNTGLLASHIGYAMNFLRVEFRLAHKNCVACENGSACDTCSVKHK